MEKADKYKPLPIFQKYDLAKNIQLVVKMFCVLELKGPTKNLYIHHKLLTQRITHISNSDDDGWMNEWAQRSSLHQRNSAKDFV